MEATAFGPLQIATQLLRGCSVLWREAGAARAFASDREKQIMQVQRATGLGDVLQMTGLGPISTAPTLSPFVSSCWIAEWGCRSTPELYEDEGRGRGGIGRVSRPLNVQCRHLRSVRSPSTVRDFLCDRGTLQGLLHANSLRLQLLSAIGIRWDERNVQRR